MTTTAPAKPRTTFSQEYVVARIEARIASLKSRLAVAKEALAEFRREQGQLRAQFIVNAQPSIKVWAERVTAFDPNSATTEEANDLARDFAKWAGDWDSMPDIDYRRRHEVLEPLLRENREMEAELDLLDHAYAYVKESTIEEYTITSLQRLGLLDVVKFVLTPEAEARRTARAGGRRR